MVKLGLIQTASQSTNQKGIFDVVKILKKLGRNNTDIVCLPEQWLKNNEISDFDLEFSEFKKISKEYSMTIIPGAFYEITKKQNINCIHQLSVQEGEIIGKQEKIHPYDYEKENS